MILLIVIVSFSCGFMAGRVWMNRKRNFEKDRAKKTINYLIEKGLK